MINVLVWNENYHEQTEERVKAIYPNGMHNTIADFLRCDDIKVRTATIDDENCGITPEILKETDVIIWWGHMRHGRVPDEVAKMVQEEVLKGMGAIFLHSAHHSKPFKLLMGTSCNLSWRDDGELERVWVLDRNHPITEGLEGYFEIPKEEMYGEPFGIPEPDKLLMIGWYENGEVFRSGCVYKRGQGNIFYFQPGHEQFPVFHQEEVQRVIRNAVRWAKPVYREEELVCPHAKIIGR
ncbi:MAG: ThuA domain-containing protein [Clostridia bacterium]|nr:ThuA domain-containing protein [Clostridia bacterium]